MPKYECYHCHQYVINYFGKAKRPQVRCRWCHKRFYLSEANLVKEKKPLLSSSVINGKTVQSSDVSVLRAFHLFLLKKHHRGSKINLIDNLIYALEKLKLEGEKD